MLRPCLLLLYPPKVSFHARIAEGKKKLITNWNWHAYGAKHLHSEHFRGCFPKQEEAVPQTAH